MGAITAILSRAHARAEAQNLPYSGALLPEEALQLMQLMPHAKLVDVRTQAEWQFVSTVPNAKQIEFKAFPTMQQNPHFVQQLKHQVDPEAVVLFLCRTGARSDAAARLAAENGYSNCYNILEGFEGEKDNQGQRGNINGWRAKKLPWTQG